MSSSLPASRQKQKYRLIKTSDDDNDLPPLKRFKSTGDDFVLRELTYYKDKMQTNDEIHENIEVCPVMKALVDTEVFQRLRNINQLGNAQYVYTCANHNRFQVRQYNKLQDIYVVASAHRSAEISLLIGKLATLLRSI